MPDAAGKLTPEDEATVKAWFVKHWKGPLTCEVCKSTSWGAGTHVLLAPRYSEGGLTEAAPTYPLLPVYCNTCAHVVFFNAVPMGLVAPLPRSDTASPG